jgi:S-(hydroxymethyl)glutathione dehydrogenase/alcohol dehydrogenase
VAPALALAHNRPPCASTIERQIDSPSPKPLGFVVEKASNKRSCSAGASPGPESRTATRTSPASPLAVLISSSRGPSSMSLVFGLGGIGLNVIQGLRLAGADMIIGVDVNNGKKEWGERFGMTHFVNPKEAGSDLVGHLVNMTKRGADQIGGADYTFDCTGNVTVMRQALEACHRGWGQSIIIGVAPAGAEIATRPFQLVTGRAWKGTAFGGARGRTDVPKIVDWYMEGKIEIDPMITHTMPLTDVNKGFELMHEGKSIRSVVVY